MVDVEKERAAFEEWAKTHFGCSEYSFSRAYPSGYYNTVHSNTFGGTRQAEYAPVSMLWDVWQAAKRDAATQPAPIPARNEQDKLARAERALLRAGFQDLGGQEWKPPVNEVAGALHRRIFELENQMTDEAKDAARWRWFTKHGFFWRGSNCLQTCWPRHGEIGVKNPEAGNAKEAAINADIDAAIASHINAGQAGREQDNG